LRYSRRKAEQLTRQSLGAHLSTSEGELAIRLVATSDRATANEGPVPLLNTLETFASMKNLPLTPGYRGGEELQAESESEGLSRHLNLCRRVQRRR